MERFTISLSETLAQQFDELIHRKVVTPPDVEREREAAWEELTGRHQALKDKIAQLRESGVAEHQTGEYQLDRSASPEVDTTVNVVCVAVIAPASAAVP